MKKETTSDQQKQSIKRNYYLFIQMKKITNCLHNFGLRNEMKFPN